MAARLRKLTPEELIRLVKPKVIQQTVQGTPGPQGPVGPPGPPGVTKIVREVVEIPAKNYDEEIAALRKQISTLEQRKPEKAKQEVKFVGGGNPVTYIPMTQQVMHFRKPSFNPGINIIGVRYAGAATVYLPHDLEPTMLVSVKDEAGSGNITILVE